jgi:homoserine kinase
VSARAGSGGEPAGRRRVVVEVPASSANLGAGYDALALALEITNRVEIDVVEEPGLEISVEGEGADSLPRNRDNRFVAALETGLRPARHDLPEGLRIRMHNAIPLTRGLGSSAAATIGGLVAASALLGEEVDTRGLLAPAIALEGHPDNAAAALLGGLVAVTDVDGTAEAVRLDPPDVAVVLFVPELQLRTADMRGVLPRDVPREDAVFNVGRVAVGVAGIAAGRPELLGALTQDRLHEPYRARHFPAFPRLVAAARAAGALGACLSGSGSTVIAFVAPDGPLEEVARALARSARESGLEGHVARTRPRVKGATVLEAH